LEFQQRPSQSVPEGGTPALARRIRPGDLIGAKTVAAIAGVRLFVSASYIGHKTLFIFDDSKGQM
jgi:hypothetical protein